MEVIKIDIKKEPMEIRDSSCVQFARVENHRPELMSIGEVPDYGISSAKIERYEVRSVVTPSEMGRYGLERKKINYLVNIEDSKIFNHLIQIGDADLQKVITNAHQKAKDYYARELRLEIALAEQREHDRIKCLSWWKRLLNRF